MTKKGLHRLFFALDFSDKFKQALYDWQLSLDIHGNLVEPDNFHLTLLFLGAIKNHQVFDIIDGITLPEQSNFTLSPGPISFFMKTEILHCEIDQGHSSVMSLHKNLKQQTLTFDFIKKEKRSFIPHITLAREVKPPTDFAESISISESIDGFRLVESIQIKSGVVYETIEQWRLNTPTTKQQLLGR